MAIEFLTWSDVEYGRAEQVSPLIRRVTAPNPGPFTYTGTGTYIVGHGDLAIIDPGPEDDSHVAALLGAVGDGTVTHIFVTHTHRDHSPASRALAAATGATIVGCGPHPPEDVRSDFHDADVYDPEGPEEEPGDFDHRPQTQLLHGDIIEGAGWTLEAVATPGHISNHLCFALAEERTLFSGDHVMGWSTTVIPPPAGDLRDYMRSLELVLERDDVRHVPTHGPPIEQPSAFVAALLDHRRAREAQIVEQLRGGDRSVVDIVGALYADIDEKLHKAAGASVQSHLAALVAEGVAAHDDDTDTFHLV